MITRCNREIPAVVQTRRDRPADSDLCANCSRAHYPDPPAVYVRWDQGRRTSLWHAADPPGAMY